MEFRPCIDIHNGKVKQIVGGSLKDRGDFASENFVSEQDSRFYADMYRKSGIKGGHIILLNSVDSEYYEDTKEQAVMALEAYPQGLQVGGGITADNAMEFIDAGAAAVIVTSYVFKDGRINYANLNRLKDTVGSDRLVLDLSCRKKDGQYYIVTDRWQNFTDEAVTTELLDKLSSYCCEFLVHAVDVEGRVNGIEKELVAMLFQMDKAFVGVDNLLQIDVLADDMREGVFGIILFIHADNLFQRHFGLYHDSGKDAAGKMASVMTPCSSRMGMPAPWRSCARKRKTPFPTAEMHSKS